MAHTTVIRNGSPHEEKRESVTAEDGNATPMGAFYASLILFLGRAWDAITDPLVGYMVTKSGRTRMGKLIPWIVFSMPLGVLAYIMMWFTPQEAIVTMSPTPHSTCSWGETRRTETLPRATGQIVGVYHAKSAQVCSQLNYSEAFLHNFSSPLIQNFSSPLTDTLQNTRRAYVLAALVLGGLYFLCCVVLFLGVKEQLAPLSTLGRIRMPYLEGMKMVVGHTPYTAATLSIPIWQTLLLRLGKKTTLYIGLSMYVPALVIIASIRSNLPVFIIMSIISGSSLSALYLLPWSMLPDVVDDFKVKNPTSTDLEPMFYSCYVFFNKFGGGMSVGISTLALHFAGYKPGACRQNPAVITALRALFAPVPIVLLLVGLVLFYFYPINEERRRQIHRELQEAEKVDGCQVMDAL
ncbi:unnamed protein product [Coregonus sp. 'balchen']|nr:unnamed protein product [Coregonus sp. 'balchen']